MGRIRPETLAAIEEYSDRVLGVAEELEKQRRWRRIIDQLVGSGGSVGANVFEADQAISKRDFAKILGITLKELSETKFWLRRVIARGWIKAKRLEPLLCQTDEWLAVFNSMVIKTRMRNTDPARRKTAASS